MAGLAVSTVAAAPAGEPSVKSVTAVADPCDLSRQRIKKVGGSLLGAALGFGICRLAAQVIDPNSRTATKNRASAACALFGGIVGYNRSADAARRQCEVAQIARRNQLSVTFQEITVSEPPPPAEPAAPASPAARPAAPLENVIAVTTLPGLAHFDSGSAALAPQAQRYFRDIAQQYTFEGQRASLSQALAAGGKTDLLKPDNLDALREEWAEIPLVLVGHSDDTGSDALNAQLSEKRARAVAEVFSAAGIPADKLYYQGAGSSMPVADNRTEEGRVLNRRVEVIELPPHADVARYLSLRRPNPDLLRPLPPDLPAPAAAAAPARVPSRKTSSADEWSDTNPAKSPAAKTERAPVTAEAIDFGGVPALQRNAAILAALGPPAGSASDWGFIRAAVAQEDPIYAAPCTRDAPGLDLGLPVRQLQTGAPVYRTNEYLPGLNDAAWLGSVNGHGIGLNHVAVLREGNEPVRNPEVLVFRDFERRGATPPALSADSKVKVYAGQSGLLYRIFVQRPALRCLDVVVPAGGALDAKAGALYYDSLGKLYTASYVPARVRAQ